jgi:hypothetical protein
MSMLQHTSLVQCSPWLRAAAGGLVAVALLLAGTGLRAAAQDAPKEEPKKAEPKTGDLADLQKQIDQIRKEMEASREEMRKAMEALRRFTPPMPPGGFPGGGGFGGGVGRGPFGGAPHAGRLGVMVERPSDILSDQLNLKKGQGLVVMDVRAETPAAKAGLKNNDILLELNGKPVPDEPREFARMIDDLKADTPVDATVLRKGKQETIKGLTLPEAKPEGRPGLRPLPDGAPTPPRPPR